jgi:hypothetical protein
MATRNRAAHADFDRREKHMADGQTPDQHDDFGSEPRSRGERHSEDAERAREERHGHVAADPDAGDEASVAALPRVGQPVDRTPLRERFGAEGHDR